MDDQTKLRKMFEVLVEDHAAMLVSFLSALTGSRDDAHDLAQEAFIRAFVHFDRFEGRSAEFAAWVRTIGRHLHIDRCRAAGATISADPKVLEGIEAVYQAADAYGSGETWTQRVEPLRECLGALPGRLRVVCQLHYLDGHPAKIVSDRLGVSLAAVLKRLERARKSLRECIERKLHARVNGMEGYA